MSGSSEKTERNRLLLYLAFAFASAWILFFAYILSGNRWDGSRPYLESFVSLGMLTPFLSQIVTRKLTGEGFAMTGEDSMMLGIDLQNGKWLFYVFAMLAPWLYLEIGQALVFGAYPALFDPEAYRQSGVSKELLPLMPIVTILQGALVSFAALGEEAGWRGYMMPKLIKLAGMKKAVLIGGVIWGLWHAPLTCIGHNFGTAYPGFPYAGIFLMCIFCIGLGTVLTYLTWKTGSIWPAAILHAVNNAGPGILAFFADAEKEEEIMAGSLMMPIVSEIPIFVLGAVCFVMLCRDHLARLNELRSDKSS
ncbi:MAG: CPBP family intramembrane metalloprotease [Bacteroidales bacterium]|nr:CPBP family intramembrane metalloprotease [Bacteroidales bacterium]MCM1415330.1 CPBP family intramembrane metalloprotease [bacterium]MCM1424029.1 CPBP family intramembrane metalloprotease [bacterium]